MRRNKLFAVLLALVMIVGMLPISTLAETETPASGTDIVTETPALSTDLGTEKETPAPGADFGTEKETPALGADLGTEKETPAPGEDLGTENETPASEADLVTENEAAAAAANADLEKPDSAKEAVDPSGEDSAKNDPAAEKTKSTRAKASGRKAAPLLRAAGNPGTGTWSELQETLNTAENGSTITLDRSLKATDQNTALKIQSEKSITIDLNGFRIDRNCGAAREAVAGGGVFEVEGQLTIIDSAGAGRITGGFAERGGAILIGSGAVCTIEGGAVTGNRATTCGGGIYVQGTLHMTGGSVSGNTSTDGGGIFVCEGGSIDLTDTVLSDNASTGRGGAVCNKGTAVLENGTLRNNRADSEGGAIYNSSNELTFSKCSITGNEAQDGGGIFNFGEAALNDTTITGNRADKDGGGILVCGTLNMTGGFITNNTGNNGGGLQLYGGEATLTGTAIKNNRAGSLGGGICIDEDSALSLVGGSITENSAAEGGGIRVSGLNSALSMEGAVVVKDNMDSDVFLGAGSRIRITDALSDGAKVGVYQEDAPGTPFTEGYGVHEPSADPADYFFANEGYEVCKEKTEAILAVWHKETDDAPFVEQNSQVARDYTHLNSRYWMAGISGERRLNEINIPGTHDSGMADVEGNVNTDVLSTYSGLAGTVIGQLIDMGLPIGPLVSLAGALYGGIDTPIEVSKYLAAYARSQRAYMDEQLDMGVRALDIRLSTYGAKRGYPVKKNDDGASLYLIHRIEPGIGEYFAKDRSGELLTFQKVLDQAKAFLKENPTETIILNVQIDGTDDLYEEGANRIIEHLKALSMEVNPSTGESYLYMENDEFGKRYTAYPQLKDCRGKIVLSASDADAGLIGGLVSGIGLQEIEQSKEGPFDNAEAKIRDLADFYDHYGGRDLPMDLDRQIDYGYFVGTNGVDSKILPLDASDEVLGALFGEDGILKNREGTYLGLINMDGANAKNCRQVWSTNFFDGTEYCTVTAKSGLSESDTKTYIVIKGTPITIPECIYAAPPSASGIYFEGWQMTRDKDQSDGGEYPPGTSFTVREDVTFTAQWSSGTRTPITVIWKDGDDKDGLQPDSLKIKVNDTQEMTVTKYDNWKHVYPGEVETVEPVMEGEWGAKYSGSVISTPAGGFVVTLTHTPGDKIDVKGTIYWRDDENKGNTRPDAVTLHLYANKKHWGSQEVFASDDWKFDFGQQPEYLDGTAVVYRITEDAIDGYTPLITGFVIRNVSHKASRTPTGFVFWADDDDPSNTRPESVTVNLLKDGVKIDSATVKENASGEWPFHFDMGKDDSAYTITQEDVAGYDTVIQKDGVEQGVTYVINKSRDHVHTPTELSTESAPATCEASGERKVVEYCASCTEILSEKTEEIPALGHDWAAWSTVRKESGTETGLQRRICKRDASHVQERIIPKTGHVHGLVHIAAKEGCTEDGNIEYWKCTEGDDPCGLCFEDAAGTKWIDEKDTVTPPLGHNWAGATYAWNDDDTQVTATRVCTRDASHREAETVAATKKTVKAATCTEAGKEIATSQPFKGEGFAPQTKEIIVPATGHDFGEWIVKKPATEKAEGLETRTCANCGKIETRAIPAVVAYRFTGGDGSTWTKGSSKGLTFTVKRSIGENSTFSHFTGVELDGKTVPETDASGKANWTAKSGSVILELQPAYLETLSVGNHKLAVQFDDGADAAATFNVKAKAVKPKKKDNPSGKDKTKNGEPKTGDESNLFLWILLLCASLVVIIRIISLRNRRNQDK